MRQDGIALALAHHGFGERHAVDLGAHDQRTPGRAAASSRTRRLLRQARHDQRQAGDIAQADRLVHRRHRTRIGRPDEDGALTQQRHILQAASMGVAL